MTDVNSLQSVLKFLGTQANSYEDLSYEPTFMSSAMFPVICGGDLSVTLTFMNYWKHKNVIDDISCLMTIRSQKGDMIIRDYFRVDKDVCSFKFPDLVTDYMDNDGRFVGSVELQFHSTEDLKYPYPAVSVFYQTSTGVSSVHMASRVFHSIPDMDTRLMTDVFESGFDIHANEMWTPFFCFTNGPRAISQAKVAFTAFNSGGEEKVLNLTLGDMNAYQTAFVFPDDRFELKEFLGDRVGFCKVEYDSFGIFPRLLCGNIRRDYSGVAITHSYYDVSTREEYFAFDQTSGTRGPFRSFPLLFSENVELDLNLYPIYSPGLLQFNAKIFDPDGNLIADLRDLGRIESPGNRMVSLRVRDILESAEVPLDESSLFSIECSAPGGKVSSRINYGVNYHRPGKIGTNINVSMHQDAEFIPGRRSSHWIPILFRHDVANEVLISVLSHKLDEDIAADARLRIFSEQGEIHSETMSIKNQSSKTLHMESLLAGIGYEASEGEVLWCTFESTCPYMDVYYLNLSDLGHVGGDHSF